MTTNSGRKIAAAAFTFTGLCVLSCAGKVVTSDPANAGGSSASRSSGGASSATASGGRDTLSTPPGLPDVAGSGNAQPDEPASGGSSGPSSGASGSSAGGSSAGGSRPIVEEADTYFIIPNDGWVDGASNPLHVQGAVFAAADQTSALGLMSNFMGNNACMSGTAARVDQAADACVTHMFPPPAVDCYGYFWGAELALNLNQPLDPATMMAGTPEPFDASALRGFSFEITGSTVPAPKSLRFQVETASQVFCSPAPVKLKIGLNTVLFSDLVPNCFNVSVESVSAETVKSSLIKLSWLVVTNTNSTVPFDFCVSQLRAFK